MDSTVTRAATGIAQVSSTGEVHSGVGGSGVEEVRPGAQADARRFAPSPAIGSPRRADRPARRTGLLQSRAARARPPDEESDSEPPSSQSGLQARDLAAPPFARLLRTAAATPRVAAPRIVAVAGSGTGTDGPASGRKSLTPSMTC